MTRNNAFRQMVAGGCGRAKVCEMLLVYFAVNPDEELTVPDALVKFGVEDRSSMWKSATRLAARGMLSITKGGRRNDGLGGRLADTYSIGPELRRIVGGGE